MPRAAGLQDTAPSLIREGYRSDTKESAEIEKWVENNWQVIVPILLRTMDLDDDTIVSLVRLNYVAVGESPKRMDAVKINPARSK